MTTVSIALGIVTIPRALFAEIAGFIRSDRDRSRRAGLAKILRRIVGRSRSWHERRTLYDRTLAGEVWPRFNGVLQAGIPVTFERPRLAQEPLVSSEDGKLFPWLENVRWARRLTQQDLADQRERRHARSGDCLWEVGMLISPALAAHGVVGTGGGGGTALLTIIGVAIVFLLVYVGQKKWRRRRRGEDGSDR